MRERRPPKDVVRSYWADEFAHRVGTSPGHDGPVYLTLPGEQGLDIRHLQDRGLVGKTQVGGIPDADAHKIVAVERSSNSVLELQSNLPGLKIYEMDIRSLLRGDSQLLFPDAEHREACRALIVNLDLNAPLKAVVEDEQLLYPVLNEVAKFSRLHAEPPAVRDWSLLLTLHGEITGPPGAWDTIRETLAENCRQVAVFCTGAQGLLGDEVFGWIGGASVDVATLANRGRELLMVFVPKRIVDIGRADGWAVRTERNMMYPGSDPSPGMVSWIFRFSRDPRTRTNPTVVYREGVAAVLSNVESLGA